MAIQGLRSTADFVADQRPKNFREAITITNPNGMAPLTAILSLMKSQNTDDPEFSWWEKEQQTRRVALGASLTAPSAGTVQSVTVGSGARAFAAGNLLYVEQTGEIVRVNSDPTGDTSLSLVRGFAGTTPTAVTYNGTNINPNLVSIGTAFEEGSLAPTGISFDPSKKYNYTQIFRATYEMTRTAQKTRLRTGDAVKEAKRECMEIFQMDMERALWKGIRYEGTSNGKPIRSTGGIIRYIDSSNIKDVSTDYAGGLTMDGLESYLESIFRYGSNEKMMFLGNRAFTTLNKLFRKNSHVHMTGMEKEYGVLNVSRVVTGYGTLVLKTHPLFNQESSGTNAASSQYYGWDAHAFVLDLKNLRYRFIDDIKAEGDLSATGQDGMKSGFMAEAGLEVSAPKTHFWLKNLHTATYDA